MVKKLVSREWYRLLLTSFFTRRTKGAQREVSSKSRADMRNPIFSHFFQRKILIFKKENALFICIFIIFSKETFRKLFEKDLRFSFEPTRIQISKKYSPLTFIFAGPMKAYNTKTTKNAFLDESTFGIKRSNKG